MRYPSFKKYRINPFAFVLIEEIGYEQYKATLHRRSCSRILMTKESRNYPELLEWVEQLRLTLDKPTE